jgi:hypothetical protein
MNTSKRTTTLILHMLLLLFPLHAVLAATVEIDWQDPETWRDIEAGNENLHHFQVRVISELSGCFTEAATVLPAEQTLRLVVTDVDLAGEMEYFTCHFPQGVRVIRDLYFPSINLDYTLVDADGNVLRSGTADIKDMSFLFSGRTFVHDAPFDYEKRMIEEWFRKTFPQDAAP